MKWKYMGWLMLCAVCLYCMGCGVKSYPKPPKQVPLPVVKDLRFAVADDTAALFWTVPSSKSVSDNTECVVYRTVLNPDEPPCKGCPLTFERLERISLGNGDKDEAGNWRMRYETPVEKGFEYGFKVTLKPGSGPESEDSNIVTVTP